MALPGVSGALPAGDGEGSEVLVEVSGRTEVGPKLGAVRLRGGGGAVFWCVDGVKADNHERSSVPERFAERIQERVEERIQT